MIPFRLTNALTIVMELVNIMFQQYLEQFMVMFEDILMYSKTNYEHNPLRVILQTLNKNKVYIKLSNYEFWLDKVIVN